MPITTLRHRKPDAYTIAPGAPPRYHAFFLLPNPLAPDPAIPTNLLAAIYASDGTWRTDRATLPLPPIPPSIENATLIANDPNAAVGLGSLAWRSAPNELTVWDVTSSTHHTYQTTEAAYCSPPTYHQGHLVWVEFPDHEEEPDTGRATLVLRRAACDLTNPETLATVLFSTPVQSWTLGPDARVAAGAEALLFETTWEDDINHETRRAAGARFPLPPSSSTDPTAQDGAALDLLQGFPAADGTALGVAIATRTLQAHNLTLGAPSAPRWPTTGPWELSTESGLVNNAAVTTAGTTALLYAFPPDGPTPVVLEAPTTTTTGNPATRTPIANHPVHGVTPILLFFME